MSDGLSFERAVEHTIHNLFQQCKITRSALVQIVQGKDPNEIDFIVEFEDIVFLMDHALQRWIGVGRVPSVPLCFDSGSTGSRYVAGLRLVPLE